MKATAQNIHKVPTKDRKGGNFVSFGHQNWNLVLNMMLGIQTAVKSAIQKPDNFTSKDFNAKHIFELVPKRTSETKSSFKICTFFDYAPSVFYDLRKLYGIRNEDYLRSIGPEHMLGNLIKGNLSSLSELTSTGKSGSFFYYSSDGKYTLKTISRDEFHFLRNLLHSYYTHLVNNPQSLMIK
jgi:1-phosphatidylinositol-4-phosphate 5-kinase